MESSLSVAITGRGPRGEIRNGFSDQEQVEGLEGLVGLGGVVVSARPIAQWLEKWIDSTIGGPMHFIPEKWASERVLGLTG